MQGLGVDTPCLQPDFFNDDRMARALATQGLRPWLNIPVFDNPAYLERHPDAYAVTSLGRRAAEEWLHFVCPSRDDYLDDLLAHLRQLLAKLSPAVVSLDFIRTFVFWERVALDGPSAGIEDGCYCETCLSRFERASAAIVDRNDPAAYIHRHLLTPWTTWKCQRILHVAERIFDQVRTLAPDAKLAVQTVPWRDTDLDGAIRSRAGQDIDGFARLVDMLAPMAFTQMLGQSVQWKRELLTHVQSRTGKPVCSYVQAEPLYRKGRITADQFAGELAQARAADPAAIVVFQYEQLATQPEKAAILRQYFSQ